MSYTTIPPSAYAAGTPIQSNAFGGAVKTDLDFLFNNSLLAADVGGDPLLPNGSFEVDPNGTAGASMTGWTWTAGNAIAGNGVVTNADSFHGVQSFVMIQGNTAGQTGGTLASPFIACSEAQSFKVRFAYKCTGAGGDVVSKVNVSWYDKNQALISTSLAYELDHFQSTWQIFTSLDVTPPANTRFMKLILLGGQNSGSPPSSNVSMYWDAIQFLASVPMSRTAVFSANTNWAIPAGVSIIRVRCFGKGSRAQDPSRGIGMAGYCEGIYPVETNGSAGQVVMTFNSSISFGAPGFAKAVVIQDNNSNPMGTQTLQANNATLGAGSTVAVDGTASGGQFNADAFLFDGSGPFVVINY